MIRLEAHGWMVDLSQAATASLIAAVWQGILLAAAAGLGLRLLPKTPAAVRFAIWFGVFLVVTGLPVIALWPHAASGAGAGGHGAWLTLDIRWSLVIAAVWAVASLLRAGTLAMAAFRVRALWRRATPVGTSYRSRRAGARELPDAPGLLRRAQICASDEVDRPTVIGFFAPKILIPGWLLEKLSPAELEQIVLHEAGHLGRADDWMNLLQKIALAIFPLNPALAWVERRLCFERELACDERVLRETGAPKAYAACLARLAEHRLGRRGVALALGALGRESHPGQQAGWGPRSELARRVGRILRRGECMKPLHAKLVLGGAMLGLLAGVAGLERCPQVVGFAANPGVAKTGNRGQGTGGGTAASEYGYKDVVFRPDAEQGTPARGLVIRTHVSETGREKAGPTVMQRQAIVSGEPAKDRTPRAVAVETAAHESALDRQPRQDGGRLVQWVEVRSWVNADGLRLVLTTVRTSSDGTLFERTTGEQGQTDGEQVHPDQVRPYAAVPVQGGWLVFQL
jgi:hypothetical protein